MPTFAEAMARQNDVVTSPDGNIKARIEGGNITDLQFRPDTFERYTDTGLAEQLEYFSKLVAVQRVRSRRKALKEALGDGYQDGSRKPVSSAEREAARRENEIDVQVKSSNIKCTLLDAHNWKISIRPGTTKNVSEEAFIQEAGQVTKEMISQLRAKLHAMRMDVYGPSHIYKGMAGSQKS